LRKEFLSTDPSGLGSIEETALALETLAALYQDGLPPELHKAQFQEVLSRGVRWISSRTKEGTEFPASPIGFYFAKLWYYEKLYPVCYSIAALERVSCL
jgi:squalene-hopene/tetraprenyl-beta-curcumene cyclase